MIVLSWYLIFHWNSALYKTAYAGFLIEAEMSIASSPQISGMYFKSATMSGLKSSHMHKHPPQLHFTRGMREWIRIIHIPSIMWDPQYGCRYDKESSFAKVQSLFIVMHPIKEYGTLALYSGTHRCVNNDKKLSCKLSSTLFPVFGFSQIDYMKKLGILFNIYFSSSWWIPDAGSHRRNDAGTYRLLLLFSLCYFILFNLFPTRITQ